MSKYNLTDADIIDVAEPVLEALQAKMDATTDGIARHVWRNLHSALEAAYLGGHNATAMLMAGVISASLAGRQEDAIEALADGLRREPSPAPCDPSLSYAPSLN